MEEAWGIQQRTYKFRLKPATNVGALSVAKYRTSSFFKNSTCAIHVLIRKVILVEKMYILTLYRPN